jgi:Trm5-related predicted tRNA methylase
MKCNVEKRRKQTHEFFRKYLYTPMLRITNMANLLIPYLNL